MEIKLVESKNEKFYEEVISLNRSISNLFEKVFKDPNHFVQKTSFEELEDYLVSDFIDLNYFIANKEHNLEEKLKKSQQEISDLSEELEELSEENENLKTRLGISNEGPNITFLEKEILTVCSEIFKNRSRLNKADLEILKTLANKTL